MTTTPRLASLLASLCLAACSPEDEGQPQTMERSGTASRSTRNTAPLLGGTITTAGGGDFAVVSDAERDLLYVVNVRTRSLRSTIRLPTGSQPTRGVEDNLGQVRVALRGTGQIATIAISSGSLVRTDSVCPEPRGVAWDSTKATLLVACASGELVSVPNAGSTTVRRLGAELRDVLVHNGKIRVSTFRSAQLLDVAETVTPLALPRISLPPVRGTETSFDPAVAWRTVSTPNGLSVTVHQRAVTGDIDTIRTGLPPVVVPYYTNPCDNAVVRSAVSVADATSVLSSIEISAVLPVDVAISPDGSELAIVGAGDSSLTRMPVGNVMAGISGGICGPIARIPAPADALGRPGDALGQPVGVAYVSNGELLVHSRSPARLTLFPAPVTGATTKPTPIAIELEGSTESEAPGFRLFHTSTRGIACASCHPEGQEDGHVWTFFGQKRRTQPLSGGIAAMAPFHWKGDLGTMGELVDDTFVARMGGARPSPEVVASLGSFLDRIPSLPPPTRDTPVDMTKGRAAFDKAGCNTCHGGPLLTNGASSDVGTGDAFQVPSLKGVSRRAPFMHDGCATSMEERFTNPDCGGKTHGNVSALDPIELSDLTDFLSQL
ncbi:MAG: hypothetical protein Q8S33_17245 [Myxococcales bacterium]|nr:hypothetical protein [Myxococcales bacterium]